MEEVKPPAATPQPNATSLNSSDNVMKSPIFLVIAGVFSVSFLLYIVIFVYKSYTKTGLKTYTSLKSPIKIKDSRTVIATDKELPTYSNGIEYSQSFWLYLDKITSSTKDKLVLTRTPNNSLSSCNPLFFLDSNSSKMYISVKLKENTQLDISSLKMDNDDNYQTIAIDYVPIQKWVCVLLVVDNQYVQVFVDGELRHVKDVSQKHRSKVPLLPYGELVTGQISNLDNLQSSYISKVQSYNYALTIDHAKLLYKSGPYRQSILNNIGLDAYGLRNPFYRIDSINTDDKN